MSPLENLSDEKLVNLWNQYCDDTNLYPDHIYPNNDETFLMFQLTVRQVLTAQMQGVYDFDHQWLYIDGYANPKSCNDPIRLMDLEELEEFVIEHELI
tara:strand:- start:321 stop:614 length:294 start_codon:yes stop_codon:yes gene_type:complete